MENNKQRTATLNSRGIFKVKPEKLEEFKALIEDSLVQIEAKRSENGPMSWNASYDKEKNLIYIDSFYENEAALEFHQNNIKQIVQDGISMLAGPPESIDSEVFSFL